MNTLPRRRLSRRSFLTTALAFGATAFVLRRNLIPRAAAQQPDNTPRTLVWAWEFDEDGSPDAIGAKLAEHNLGLILKTHDGTHWMSDYDKSPYAVSGPDQVETLSKYYEAAGVPLHAWTNVRGADPLAEAQMAADVLGAGARSLHIDVHPDTWTGSPDDARTFGAELRRLAPDALIVLSIDPRPWRLQEIPLSEMAAFCNAISAQQFWPSYNTDADRDAFADAGYFLGDEGITPEFLLGVTDASLKPLGLPIAYAGRGDVLPEHFQRFINAVQATGSSAISVWRFGITNDGVFDVLSTPAAPAAPAAPVEAASSQSASVPGPVHPTTTYVVKAGDTLSVIAEQFNVTEDEILAANDLDDPDLIRVGQELVIPAAAG